MTQTYGWYFDYEKNAYIYLFIYKTKGNLPLCLNNIAPCHEDVWGYAVIATPFFTSTLDGVEWSASRSFRFNLREIVPPSPSIHWTGGRESHRAGPNAAR
jgi:hypothetical protein